MSAEALKIAESGQTLRAPVCNVCGSHRFEPGFRGRLMNGIPPACVECKTVERHRAIYRVYSELRPLLNQWRALHFAPDHSVDPEWFKSYRSSIYGTSSSLDMLATGLPDNSFEIVMSNHVLEHVPEPVLALNECLRLVGPTGIVHAMVPAQAWELNDWQFPDPAKNEHWREFGADFGLSVGKNIPGAFCIGILGSDPVTAAADMIYLISRSQEPLVKVHRLLPRVGIQVVRFF
jgi:SAM-dependent methyltransferase